MHQRSKHGRILTYIITRKKNLKLVVVKLKMRIKRKVRATGAKVPKCTDVCKLQNSKVREAFGNTFGDIDVGVYWEQFKRKYTQWVLMFLILRRITQGLV